jgi:hypothetical protein
MPEVEVLTLMKVTDIVTGATALQVNFGEMSPADPGMRERFTNSGQQPPVGDEALHVLLTILLPADGVSPYQIGSRWNLEYTPTGEVTLRRVQ